MTLLSPRVKVRQYDASRRRTMAEQRRRTVLDAAQQLFFNQGYVATTIASIAKAAGVSPETVYKGFGGKPGLVRALRARALLGTGPVPAEDRSDRLRDLADGHAVVRGWAKLAGEVAPKVAPILGLVREAALLDPTIRQLADELDTDRLRRMRANARYLADAGHLRAEVSMSLATDVLFAVSSPEMYDLLVVGRRWSVRRYSRFVSTTIEHALL
ncbi:MAG: helix-turn-helix domain-containing protein [Actinomycetota bacterium]